MFFILNIFVSVFAYLLSFNGILLNQLLNHLNLFIKKTIRIIAGVGYREHTKPLFKHYEILPIQENIHLNILKIMHKCDRGSLPEPN